MNKQNDIREVILEAAKGRLSRYGYGKTTMAELAGDCNMSAGNLYRYFMCKLDIAEAIARESFARIAEKMRKVVRQSGQSTPDKLKDLLFCQLRETWHELEHDKHMVEMAMMIAHERPEVGNEGIAQVRSLIAEVLAQGNATGELDVQDVACVAEWIQCATSKYRYPQISSSLTLPQLEKELEGVISLLVRGVACRGKG